MSYFSNKNILIINFCLLAIFSKELLVINEEFLIILSFLTVFFVLKSTLNDIIINEMNAQFFEIKKQFVSLFESKKKMNNSLIIIYEKKIKIFETMSDYINNLNSEFEQIILNRDLIVTETINIYTSQLLTNFIIYYNFELKNVYFNIISEIYNEILIERE